MNRKLLEKPFPSEMIRQRKGSFGNTLDYIEGWAVIQRLNEVFDGDWSFDVVDHQILENEVIVIAKLIASGITKVQFGGSSITKNKTTGDIVCISDDLKAAATDALKKAASLWGVGLHLYDKSNGSSRSNPQETKSKKVYPVNKKATNLQIKSIVSIAAQNGITNGSLLSMIEKRFNVKCLEDLKSSEAKQIINGLKDNLKKAKAA